MKLSFCLFGQLFLPQKKKKIWTLPSLLIKVSSCHFQQSSFTNTYSKPPYLLESRYPQSASLPTRNLASSNCYHKGNHTTYIPLSTESPGDNKGTQLFEHKRQTYNSVSKTLKKKCCSNSFQDLAIKPKLYLGQGVPYSVGYNYFCPISPTER